MANFKLPGSGEKVRLIGMSAVKLNSEDRTIHGYVTAGDIITVAVGSYIGDALISRQGRLYPLRVEFDDDFYAVVC